MSRETLNTQFWQACNVLRQDDNTNSLLDYVEQISWLLFLKCLEELEHKRRDEAEFEKKRYQPIIAAKYHWSAWTDPQKRLTGRDLLKFLNDELFPYLREIKGRQEADVIRTLFAEAPSKMLKDGGNRAMPDVSVRIASSPAFQIPKRRRRIFSATGF